MKKIFIIALFGGMHFNAWAQEIKNQQFKEDFIYFWTTVKDNYSYWDKKQTDWDKVKDLYSPLADTITTKRSFIQLLEKVLYELYDHHASLSSNTGESQRLVPTGADIWAEYINDKPVITEIRHDFGAYKAGMKVGMEILAFNDLSIEKAIQAFLPKALRREDVEAKNYALRVLLAGKRSGNRKITVQYQNKKLVFSPDEPINVLTSHHYNGLIESKIISKGIGYIRINNCLGDNSSMPLFDSVLFSLKDTRALILDLRETPSGGNTTVARSIMGSFISQEGFFQKHILTAEEREFGIMRSWVEIVSPRKWAYKKPLFLLVDHWTGSVGEGITIGFDALKRAYIIGTHMAGLNGAVYSFRTPNTGIGFSIPGEKLMHLNGTPRENFLPQNRPNLYNKVNGDIILEKAISLINATKK